RESMHRSSVTRTEVSGIGEEAPSHPNKSGWRARHEKVQRPWVFRWSRKCRLRRGGCQDLLLLAEESKPWLRSPHSSGLDGESVPHYLLVVALQPHQPSPAIQSLHP